MRIIKFLFSGFVVTAIVALVAFFIARESLLVWALADLKTSISVLRQIEKNPRAYALECRQKGTTVETDVIDKLQLRFISPTEYVLEVVCTQFSLDPIILQTKQLPQFVTKLPGNTGLIWGDSPSAIGISVLGRSRAIIIEQKEVLYSPIDENFSYGVGPISSCRAYGFYCCNQDTQLGKGDQYNGVSDCPLSCYSQCLTRPIVLSFTSDPYMDINTRITQAKTGEMVTFSYVVNANSSLDDYQVILETGDGNSYNAKKESGIFEHRYDCQAGKCSYEALLKVVNSDGIESARLTINSIRVEVSN